jgi:hypothetical protein
VAVDTRSKRASVLGIGLTAALTLPLADGAMDQADRQHVAFAYAGISAEVAIIASDVVVLVRADVGTIEVRG